MVIILASLQWDDLISRIIPDLRQYRLEISQYPVLITSWRLQQGDPSKPMPMPTPHQKLGLRDLKRILGLPVRRKKNPHTETWEAVAYDTGQAIKVMGKRLVGILCPGNYSKVKKFII